MRRPQKQNAISTPQSEQLQRKKIKPKSTEQNLEETEDTLEAKKREAQNIAKQLEYEKQHRTALQNLRQAGDHLTSMDPDTILWSVGLIQDGIEDLELQLNALKTGEWDEDSEYKLRYITQTNLNEKLEEQIDWYEDEVEKMKIEVKKGEEITFDKDLERYNELELQQMIKNLERERNNIYSDLRNKSWLLDSQSKKYHHLKELSRAYKGDLTIVNRSLEQLWRQRSRSYDSGFNGDSNTPMTSPGALTWSGESGIRPSQRILDPRKGPVKKTVGVRSLPRLDPSVLDHSDGLHRPRKISRSRSVGRKFSRTKSLESKKNSIDLDSLSSSIGKNEEFLARRKDSLRKKSSINFETGQINSNDKSPLLNRRKNTLERQEKKIRKESKEKVENKKGDHKKASQTGEPITKNTEELHTQDSADNLAKNSQDLTDNLQENSEDFAENIDIDETSPDFNRSRYRGNGSRTVLSDIEETRQSSLNQSRLDDTSPIDEVVEDN